MDKSFWQKNNFYITCTHLGLKTPRIPISISLEGDWICHFLNANFKKYYSEFDYQQKMRLEASKITEKELGLKINPAIDFGVVMDASIYGGKVIYNEIAPPTLEPVINDPTEVYELSKKMRNIDLKNCGLIPKFIEWQKRLKDEFKISIKAGNNVKGPATMAAQICGLENYLTWLITNPDEMLHLMQLIGEVTIQYIKMLRKITSNFTFTLFMANDVAGLMSAQMYEKFCFPIEKKIFNSLSLPFRIFRLYHADSDMNHLLSYLNKLNIGAVNLGPQVEVKSIRNKIPKAIILGHIPPTQVLLEGSYEDVINTCKQNIEDAGTGRIILTTAGSINAGTPLNNLRALIEASIKFSK